MSDALTIFSQLDAMPWMNKARTELRAAGARIEAGEVLSTLTAQELAVAELAATGFSNKQIAEQLFLSARTVGGHLYRAYPKLGISSRSALRDALTGLADMPAVPGR